MRKRNSVVIAALMLITLHSAEARPRPRVRAGHTPGGGKWMRARGPQGGRVKAFQNHHGGKALRARGPHGGRLIARENRFGGKSLRARAPNGSAIAGIQNRHGGQLAAWRNTQTGVRGVAARGPHGQALRAVNRDGFIAAHQGENGAAFIGAKKDQGLFRGVQGEGGWTVQRFDPEEGGWVTLENN